MTSKKAAADPTQAVLDHTDKSPIAAALVVGVHRQLQLWRLCRWKACRRAHACCGKEPSCAARRWKVARSVLASANLRLSPRTAHRFHKRITRRWSEVKGVLCRHQEFVMTGLPRGPLLQVYRDNPDGTKTVVFQRDLTREQGRKLSNKIKALQRRGQLDWPW
jgi:hypothetical protein